MNATATAPADWKDQTREVNGEFGEKTFSAPEISSFNLNPPTG
jgi:hypothetical protein